MKSRVFLFGMILTLVGCGSTPYTDDYTRHVNTLKQDHFTPATFKFGFDGNEMVDMRGDYQRHDEAAATPILYQGGGGVAGLLVQIGTHSSIINAERNSKREAEQLTANAQIQPLINLTKDIKLDSLLGELNHQRIPGDALTNDELHVRPIFFSNHNMTELSLKLIAWVPEKKVKRGQTKRFKYSNLVQVYAPALSNEDSIKLLEQDKTLVKKLLADMLSVAMGVVKKELTGGFSDTPLAAKTWFRESGGKKEVIRGSQVDETCGYQIIKNLRAWYIVLPKDAQQMLSAGSASEDELTAQC